jgi:hypothetical protein
MSDRGRKKLILRILSVVLAGSNTLFLSVGGPWWTAGAVLFFAVPVLCVCYPDAMCAPIELKWPVAIRTPPIPRALVLGGAWLVLACVAAGLIVVGLASLMP